MRRARRTSAVRDSTWAVTVISLLTGADPMGRLTAADQPGINDGLPFTGRAPWDDVLRCPAASPVRHNDPWVQCTGMSHRSPPSQPGPADRTGPPGIVADGDHDAASGRGARRPFSPPARKPVSSGK